MVAVIHQSRNLRIALNYNEHKVKAGLAACIEAGYYPVGPDDMTFHQKLRRLEMLTELNQRTKHNCLHVSLNFDPSESLNDHSLREIAEVYLERIGFGGQPYLLYRHDDAGHPHVHIVTTNIKSDGRAIHMNNLGKNKSEPARQYIEKLYGLVEASGKQKWQVFRQREVDAARVAYGKAETKQAINNVLVKVLKSYHYTSLSELNALLGLYNIRAERGEENSRIFKHGGLVYQALDSDGNKIGVPIKASLFFAKPTLKFLEGQFGKNKLKQVKETDKLRVKNAVDKYFLGDNKSLDGLRTVLKRQGIDVVARVNEQDVLYGITYVDHQAKCVFKGSDLGKAYSANAMRERGLKMAAGEGKKQNGKKARLGVGGYAGGGKGRNYILDVLAGKDDVARMPNLAEVLLETDSAGGGMDWELKRTKKKKKKKVRLSL